jgi:hypothetical protein
MTTIELNWFMQLIASALAKSPREVTMYDVDYLKEHHSEVYSRCRTLARIYAENFAQRDE